MKNVGDLKLTIQQIIQSFTIANIEFPQTVCLFPDGNSRFAVQKNMSLSSGYNEGIQNLFIIVKLLTLLKVKNIFILLFTSENLKKRPDEMKKLAEQIGDNLVDNFSYFYDNNLALDFAGDITIFSKEQQRTFKLMLSTSSDCDINVCLGINYSAESEIKMADGDLTVLPFSHPIDLLIRTGNNTNIPPVSAIMLSGQNRFFSKSCLWPQFTETDLLQIYSEYLDQITDYGNEAF
jgi:undecaprenyl pyrophosphate synthase